MPKPPSRLKKAGAAAEPCAKRVRILAHWFCRELHFCEHSKSIIYINAGCCRLRPAASDGDLVESSILSPMFRGSSTPQRIWHEAPGSAVDSPEPLCKESSELVLRHPDHQRTWSCQEPCP